MFVEQVRSAKPRPGRVVGSLLDYFIREAAVPMVYFCREPLDADALKGALAVALTTHPVFAGAVGMEGDQLVLSCNNQGARFSVQDVDLTLDELYAGAPVSVGPLVDSFHGGSALRRGTPVLTIRLSRLRSGASTLGVCWHHSVGDLASFMSLMRNWVRAFRGEPLLDPPEVEDRGAYLDAKVPPGGGAQSSMHRLPMWSLLRMMWSTVNARSRYEALGFHFTEEETVCMQRALSERAGSWLSAGDAVVGHLMATLMRFDSKKIARSLSLAVNIRKRLRLPDDVLGNLLGSLSVDCAADATAASIAVSLRRGLERYAEDHLDYNATKAFVEASGGRTRMRFAVPRSFDFDRHNLVVSNWSRYGLYDTFFGRERPEFFITTFMVPWIAVVSEGPGGRGCLANVTLPKELAAALRTNEARALLHAFRPRGDVPDGATTKVCTFV